MPAPHVWIVAVPETVGVHWKTRSGALPELPQLPASTLVPLVVPVKVPPCAGMTVGLVQPPTRVTGAAAPWQTPRPSLLQRMSVCLVHVRRRPPAATHEAISSVHARRHCLPTEAASAPAAARSTATNPTSPVNHPALVLMPSPRDPPGLQHLELPGFGYGGLGLQVALLAHLPWRLRPRDPVSRGWTQATRHRCATQS